MFFSLYPITTRVPQGSVLGSLVYLLFTVDIPVTDHTILGTFADVTIIVAVDTTYDKTIEKLPVTLGKINQRTED